MYLFDDGYSNILPRALMKRYLLSKCGSCAVKLVSLIMLTYLQEQIYIIPILRYFHHFWLYIQYSLMPLYNNDAFHNYELKGNRQLRQLYMTHTHEKKGKEKNESYMVFEH